MKFTPGPWRVHPDFPLCVGRYSNLCIQQCRYGHGADRETNSICNFDGPRPLLKGEYPGNITYEEAKANALLIAAAPDLLAACKAVMNNANHIDCDAEKKRYIIGQKEFELIDAALAKAEGVK